MNVRSSLKEGCRERKQGGEETMMRDLSAFPEVLKWEIINLWKACRVPWYFLPPPPAAAEAGRLISLPCTEAPGPQFRSTGWTPHVPSF